MPAQVTEQREQHQQDELTSEQGNESVAAHAGNVASTSLHIIIPVLNEAEALHRWLPSFPVQLLEALVVVDNGSTDGSAAVAGRHGVRVVREPRRGYGAACLAGIAALGELADHDIILFMDGDASDDLDDIPDLLEPIREQRADLVLGSRVLGARERGSLGRHARFGNWLATRLIRLKTGYRFTDLGPLRAIRADVLRDLQMQDRAFGWTVEMQLKAAQRGLRIREVPVRYHRRIGRSKISGSVSGSLQAGFTILRTILRHGA